MNISSHSDHILKHLVNELCPFSTQITFSNTLLGFFLYFMTLLFMLFFLKNKNFNFHSAASIQSVTTFCLFFLASVFEASRSLEKVATKFFMYHSCSSPLHHWLPLLALLFILWMTSFVVPLSAFDTTGQMCFCNSYLPHFPDLTYTMYSHPVFKWCYNKNNSPKCPFI